MTKQMILTTLLPTKGRCHDQSFWSTSYFRAVRKR